MGDLLAAEIAEKHARSIKYQLTIAKLPLAKDLDDFVFDGTPINDAKMTTALLDRLTPIATSSKPATRART